jgi:hypothetical protein
MVEPVAAIQIASGSIAVDAGHDITALSFKAKRKCWPVKAV